jgi:hypothetical protein
MNKELEIGQRVRLNRNTYWDTESKINPLYCNGTVIECGGLVLVKWDNEVENDYSPYDEDLVPVEEE